jgi:hypothetical protein
MVIHHNPFLRLAHWIKAHRLLTFVVIGVILISAAAATTYYILSQPMPKPAKIAASKPKPVIKFYSPLTGVEVPTEAATKQVVTAIMIENSPDARPQSGIKDAGIVFEAIAEGGITRFLTLHQEDKPQLIGPVRSLRMYYVDWLAPFNASVAHIGGSAAALAEVRNGNYRDIDQFFNAGSYWRATDRYAPHNVYTSFERLDALNVAKGYTTSSFTGFPRADGKAAAAPDATSITINISSELYNSTYAYDAATNHYIRSLAGVPHVDREGGQITPSVVIALKVNEVTVMEDGYRQSITTIGSGEAIIFQNGVATAATWTKADRASQLTFTDAAGKPIALNRGQTWISAVPNGHGSVSWQ